jgi:two-component system cell cycle sensor histidine kinase/response regulator CckA
MNMNPAYPDKEPVRPAKEHGKIMIMDDDEMILIIAEAMLIHLGYESELAADGEEAVDLYQKALSTGTEADLIIMDLTIPGGMGGEDAVKEILTLNPEARVLVSSGYSNEPVMDDYLAYGFCGAIAKPYQMQELYTVIHKFLYL